jgi:hypothetical protein
VAEEDARDDGDDRDPPAEGRDGAAAPVELGAERGPACTALPTLAVARLLFGATTLPLRNAQRFPHACLLVGLRPLALAHLQCARCGLTHRETGRGGESVVAGQRERVAA